MVGGLKLPHASSTTGRYEPPLQRSMYINGLQGLGLKLPH